MLSHSEDSAHEPLITATTEGYLTNLVEDYLLTWLN